jgi:hypothetical protein
MSLQLKRRVERGETLAWEVYPITKGGLTRWTLEIMNVCADEKHRSSQFPTESGRGGLFDDKAGEQKCRLN